MYSAVSLSKLLNKQSIYRWFQVPWRPFDITWLRLQKTNTICSCICLPQKCKRFLSDKSCNDLGHQITMWIGNIWWCGLWRIDSKMITVRQICVFAGISTRWLGIFTHEAQMWLFNLQKFCRCSFLYTRWMVTLSTLNLHLVSFTNTVESREVICNYIPNIYMHIIFYPCLRFDATC